MSNILEFRESPSVEQLAYAAGLFDGEGCINIHHKVLQRGDKASQITLLMSMTDSEPVFLFKRLFGGEVYGAPPRFKHHQYQWRWAVRSKEAGRVLELLAPYLIVKRVQAYIGIFFANTFTKDYRGKGCIPQSIEEIRAFLAKECSYEKTVNE